MSLVKELSAVPALVKTCEPSRPIRESLFERGTGKRRHRRRVVPMSIRLTPLGNITNQPMQNVSARCRDVGATGLGLLLPTEIQSGTKVQVEALSEAGSWSAVMRVVHCTQTVGGYKVGLEEVTTGLAGSDASEGPLLQFAEMPTLDEAQSEARDALRRYQLAEATWGLFGTRMEREIKRIVESLPAPPAARRRLEPRRSDFRHDIDAPVCVLLPSGTTHRLLTTQLVDLSMGGARLLVAPACGEASLESAEQMALGLLTVEEGILWLPARLVHTSSPLFREKTVGLRFVRATPHRPQQP